MEDLESTNINFKWLDNVYGQLINITSMERLSKEGCQSINEYFEIPIDLKNIVIPDIMFKNLKLMIMELDILIDNLSPILKDKTKKYKEQLNKFKINPKDKELYLEEIRNKDGVIALDIKPLFYFAVDCLSNIKLNIIKDIGNILYLPEDKKKTW